MDVFTVIKEQIGWFDRFEFVQDVGAGLCVFRYYKRDKCLVIISNIKTGKVDSFANSDDY